MIVCMTIAGQSAEVTVRITSSELSDPYQRATRAASVAYTNMTARLRRAWDQQGRQDEELPVGVVAVTAVYCCPRCRQEDPKRTMAFRHPGVSAGAVQ